MTSWLTTVSDTPPQPNIKYIKTSGQGKNTTDGESDDDEYYEINETNVIEGAIVEIVDEDDGKDENENENKNKTKNDSAGGGGVVQTDLNETFDDDQEGES